MVACANEAAFGPVAGCRRMDFTLGFEYRILLVLPAAVISCLAIPLIYQLSCCPNLLRRRFDYLSIFKSTSYAVSLVALGCVLGLFGSELPWTSWGLAAYALELAISVLLAITSYLHHHHTLAPSTLLTLYLLVSVLFSATHLRTLVLLGLKRTYSPYAIHLAARLVVLSFELVEKRALLRPDVSSVSVEETSSLVSRITFAFLIPLLIHGRKTAFTLESLQLFGFPQSQSAQYAGRALSMSMAKRPGSTVIQATFRAFTKSIISPVIPRLLLVAATFTQTYLVSSMLNFISTWSDNHPSPAPVEHGWGLVGAYILVYVGITSTTALYWDKVFNSVVEYRAALVSVIFDKTLRLSSNSAKAEGSGNAVTYMSVDVERVIEGITFFHEAWSAFISIAVAAVILWYQASYAMLPPLGVILFFIFLAGILSMTVGKAQTAWMGVTESRIKFISSVMSNILPIKLTALERAIETRASELRRKEISALKVFQRRLIYVASWSTATVNFAGLAALGTYATISSGPLTPSSLFTILTAVNLVILPVNTIGHVLPQLLASVASLRRISNFLQRDEKLNGRLIELRPLALSPTSEKTLSTDHLSEKVLTSPGENLVLSNASFAPETGSDAILKEITSTIRHTVVTMVVGPVGAGKSFLLQSLLGETALISGSMSAVYGPIAYASQDAFLWPTTVRENVILNSEFDSQWYASVLEACCLGPDLERMDKGDMTSMAESGGVSGGQRQRIALARAVYAKRHTVLLDDTFSALDANTSSAVFTNLLGPGGLLRGRTVILSTHSHYHLPFADDIIVLEDGAILAQGNLSELRTGPVNVSRYISSPATSVKSTKRDESDIDDVDIDPETAVAREEELERVKETIDKAQDAPEVDEEHLGVLGSAGWKPYKFFLQSCGWTNLGLGLISIVAFAAAEVGIQIFLKYWSQSNTTNHSTWLGIYGGLAVACGLLAFATFMLYSQKALPHACIAIHGKMVNAVLSESPAYFFSTPAARLINRFGADMNIVDFGFPIAILDFTFTSATLVGSLLLVCIATPWLAIAIPVLGYAYWVLQKFYLATSRQLQRLESSSKSPLFSAFSTAFSGLITVRAFGAEDLFIKQARYHLDRSQTPMYYRYAGIRFLRTALNGMTLIIAVGIAALAVGLRRSTSAGFLGVALSQLVTLSTTLSNLLLAWTRVENGVVAIERVHEIVEVPGEEDRHLTPKAMEELNGWPSTGRVEFENVTVRYGDELEPALRNVSFTVNGGGKLGICGRTGSGKSTILLALLSGVHPSLLSGRVLIDGVDTGTVPLAKLRSSVSTVFQDPTLLHLSIRENLTVGIKSSSMPEDVDIWRALERVGMHTAVEKLPLKLDTVMGEDNTEFSRGERQLLCFARVLLEKRKIIMLDEISSSMDMQTDARVKALLESDLADCTCIAVAHRIASIVDFNSVVVLQDGQVAENDDPRELLKVEDGIFRGLAQRQNVKAA